MGLVLECNKSIDVGALVVRTDIRGVELVGIVLVGAAPRALGAIGSRSASIMCLCGTTQSGKVFGPRDIRGISGSKCWTSQSLDGQPRQTGGFTMGWKYTPSHVKSTESWIVHSVMHSPQNRQQTHNIANNSAKSNNNTTHTAHSFDCV